MKHKVGDMVYLRVMPTGAYEVSTGNPTADDIIYYVERMATIAAQGKPHPVQRVHSAGRIEVEGWYWLEGWVYDKRSLLKDYFSL
jgi:hypothetical protein